MSKFFDFRFSIFIVMANIKNFLTTVFQYSTYNRMSFFFYFRFSIFIRMANVKNFFFLLFIFRYSSLNFEKRKAKIKLNFIVAVQVLVFL